MRIRGRAALVLCLVFSSHATADGPEVPASADETPWGKGVSPERKASAEQLLGEGNALFVQNKFREALAKYEEAIAQWDHPAIHFNIVRALLALDRPLEAHASLDKALAYGAAPIEEHYAEALNYKKLIDSKIGTLEIACKQAGVKIRLDGAETLVCPGTVSKRLLPGNHVIVGAKPGHQTETKDVVVTGGGQLSVSVELLTTPQATVYRPRWATWKPWVVVGSGIAIAGLGLGLNQHAASRLEDLEAAITATCPPEGCTTQRFDELGHAGTESSIELESRMAVGMIVGGGVIAAAGLVGVIVNRPQPYLKERPRARVVTSISPTGAGVAVEGRF